MSRVGVIVRQDLTGLGVQTRAIAKLLGAHKLIVVDFSPLNGNEQHPELLNGLTANRTHIRGWIGRDQLDEVLSGIDTLVSCEIDYSIGYTLTARAKQRGVKTIIVANFEFSDWLQRPLLPRPDTIALHSEWRICDFAERMGFVPMVLRTPIDMSRYEDVFSDNKKRSYRFLHVAGRKTHDDRNGTQDLIKAVSLIPDSVDFELVIKTQTAEVVYANSTNTIDSRIKIDSSQPVDERDLYRGFDAMVLPRRYAGASLPMNEALASGLPVIMTHIDPNDLILPHWWLVDAERVGSFDARTTIDVYSADEESLAGRIAQFAVLSDETLEGYKKTARKIAEDNFSEESVMKEWKKVL